MSVVSRLANRRRPGLKKAGQAGFTIIEVAVASVGLTAILIITLNIFLDIGSKYFEEITKAKSQNVIRVIVDDISSSITTTGGQLLDYNITTYSSSDIGGWRAYCLGGISYYFKLNQQLKENPSAGSSNQTSQALIRTVSPGGCPDNSNLTNVDYPAGPAGGTISDGIEMLLPRMRILEFSIEEFKDSSGTRTGLYQIKIKIATGGDPDDANHEKDDFRFDDANSNGVIDIGEAVHGCNDGFRLCAVVELEVDAFQRIRKDN